MKDVIEVQGQEVSREVFKKALEAVLDAIPKGKRAPLFRQMSIVEAVGMEAYRDDPK